MHLLSSADFSKRTLAKCSRRQQKLPLTSKGLNISTATVVKKIAKLYIVFYLARLLAAIREQ